MAESNEMHNEVSASVAGNVFQAGAVHGDVVMLPRTSDRLGADEAQRGLVRHLAGEVRAQSVQELRQWGIRDRDALSVRWHTAAEDLLDHWENIHDSPEALSLTGQFAAIRDTYKAVRSKRLVILGRAGAGKTVLAHRLILDLLDAAAPVPVLFGLSDWNPAIELSRWLVQQLVRDFPFLEANDSTTGKRQADVLVERGLILPVLDGFDEIPEQHHRAAIGEISNLDVPLLVTSRPDEYARAARGVKAIGGAVAIELEDLTLAEAHRYLRLSTSRNRSPEWDAVFERLRTRPDDTASRNLTRVLTTPLTVTLAGTVHDGTRGHRPPDLLNTQRFPNTEAVEDHLLGAYLDTVYERRAGPRTAQRLNPGPDRARRWLGHLAGHLKDRNTHDLTWWRLPTTLHRHTRVLVTSAGLAGGLAFALVAIAYGVDGLVHTMSGGFGGGVPGAAVQLAHESAFGATFGLTGGLAAGLAAGLVNEVEFSRGRTGREPERLRLDPRPRSRAQRSSLTGLKKSLSEFASGFAVALSVGLAVGLVGGAAATPLHRLAVGLAGGLVDGIAITPIYALAVGLGSGVVLGLVYGLVNVVVSALGDPHDPRATTPWTLLTRDRTVALVRTITTVLAVGLAVGLMYAAVGFEPEVAVGLALGLLSGMARLALSAWGSWLLFTRLWLPLTGRLPWRPKLFLEDAYRRGVLRRNGAVYQFRHARVRDYLAAHHRT